FGVLRLHFADHPFPEGEGLCVRVVDAEDRYPMADPEQDDVAQRVPEARDRLAVEMDVDDVFVFLRRVLGELDGAIRPPVKPFRMLLDPWMVRRALDREVERDQDTFRAGGFNQPVKILECAELGMYRVVTAVFRADGIGAARIVRTGCQAVVRTLAIGPADRVNGREVKNVEAQILHVRETGDY